MISLFLSGLNGRIDILINNAGVYQSQKEITAEGLQHEIAVNFYGPVFLTKLILQKNIGLEKVVNVTSNLAKYGSFFLEDMKGLRMDKKVRYRNSKLALTAYTFKASHEYRQKGIKFLAVHPGLVLTRLGRNALPSWSSWIVKICFPFLVLLAKMPCEGAQSILYCLIDANSSGYYGNCKKEEWPNFCKKTNSVNQMYEETNKFLSYF